MGGDGERGGEGGGHGFVGLAEMEEEGLKD